MAQTRSRAGRPRDSTIDERALAATQRLLVERGFGATTIQAVAEAAGIHASAIYRRWPSRIELISEAGFPGIDPVSVEPTGDLERDLRRFVRAYLATFAAPPARAAAAGLLAHHQSVRADGRTARSPDLLQRVSVRPQFRAILKAAPPGRVDPAVDPDDAFDLLLGAVLTRVLLPPAATRRRPVGPIVELIIRALVPR